jgi:hypothetical protein
MHSEAEFLFWENNFLLMTNSTNLDKRVINKKKAYMYNTQEHNKSLIPFGSINIQISTIFNKHRKIITIKNL